MRRVLNFVVVGSTFLAACGDDTSSSDVGDTEGTGPDQTSASTTVGTVGPSTVTVGTVTTAFPTTSDDTFPTSADSTETSWTTGTTVDPTFGTSDTDSTGPGDDGFPPGQPFGDNVQELDIVGVWGLNWDPGSGWDSVLEIDEAGDFLWVETSADCSEQTVASGYLWVAGSQLVMHVEQWEGGLPWDTEPVMDEVYPAPFRMQLSFSLQGDYLAIAGPAGLTDTTPYTGESFIRQSTDGSYLGGVWRGEAELHAIRPGQSEAVVIVRDVFEATLDPEQDTDPEGTGLLFRQTIYFPNPHQDLDYPSFNWTCLDGCPTPSGTTLIAGSNLYTYGPYAAQTHLMPFATGRAFLRNAASDCGD
jgi:hypothetical protein